MNRRQLDDLMRPRNLPDQHRTLRDVLGAVAAERARPEPAGAVVPAHDSSVEPDFSDSAFRPITHSGSRPWLTYAVAAATAIVVGGLGWSVVIQSPLNAQPGPGGQPVQPINPTPSPTPSSTSTPRLTPTPTPRPSINVRSVRPPSVSVVEHRAAGQVVFVTYRVCSGSGAATVTGPVGNRDTSVELPVGMPPRMNAYETVGPDECVLRGEAFTRPVGSAHGRLDVRFTFEDSAPEKQFNAYYGDVYSGH